MASVGRCGPYARQAKTKAISSWAAPSFATNLALPELWKVPCSPTPHSLVGQLGWQREPGVGNCWQDLPMKLLPLPASCHVVCGPLGTCASFSEEMEHPSPSVWGSHPVPHNTGLGLQEEHTQMRHWSGLLKHGREWAWGKCLQQIWNMASPLCRAAGNST